MARLRDVSGDHRGVTRLPGVGERLDVADADGAVVVVVRRNDGLVEIHSPAWPCVLDETAASSVGAFMAGHFVIEPEVADRMADVLGGLAFDWVRIEDGDWAAGQTIAELDVRQRTGVTIVAVLRGSQPIVAPASSLRLEPCDDLIFLGCDLDREGFSAFLAKGE